MHYYYETLEHKESHASAKYLCAYYLPVGIVKVESSI